MEVLHHERTRCDGAGPEIGSRLAWLALLAMSAIYTLLRHLRLRRVHQ